MARKTRTTSKAARKEGRIKPRKIVEKEDVGEEKLPLTPTQQAEWDYKKKVIKAAREMLRKMPEKEKEEMYRLNGYWQPGDPEKASFMVGGKQYSKIKRDLVRRDIGKDEPRSCLKCDAHLNDAEAEFCHNFGHDQDAKCVCPECKMEFGRPDSLRQHAARVHKRNFVQMRKDDELRLSEYKKVWTLGKTVYSDITRCSANFPAGYLKVLPVGSRNNVF